MTTNEAWHSFAVAALNGLLINRRIPLSVDEDYHYIENASAVCAKFADEMTEQRKKRQPQPKQKRKAA